MVKSSSSKSYVNKYVNYHARDKKIKKIVKNFSRTTNKGKYQRLFLLNNLNKAIGGSTCFKLN
jgi:hypothetical protein